MQFASPALRRVGGAFASLALVAFAACGDSTDPTDVTFGETTFVVVVNPIVNDANQATVPAPGGTQNGVSVTVEGGPSATTSASGVAVLAPVDAGTRVIELSGPDNGQTTLTIAEGDLREVALSLDASGAEVMADIQYAVGGNVVEITPSMSLEAVNLALAASGSIVFFRAGNYTGDLVFSGSNVTLFGEGATGGSVTLTGSVTVDGSNNRIRGARITGDLSVPGSDFGMSFSRVSGATDVSGSDAVLLNNSFCGTVSLTGGGSRLVGNAGIAPIAASGC